MKKIWILVILALMAQPAFAGHRRYFTSASDLNSGTLPNARLDPSSVTLLGSNNIHFSSGGSENFTAGSASFTFITAVQKIGLGTVQYTPPTTDGSNTQVLTTNGAGILSWATDVAGGGSVRNFDGVIIGTRNSLSVDATIGSNGDWITVLSSFGMAGLTTSTTAQGQIFLRNGSYANWITTIPAGATVLCQSSAVLVVNSLGGRSIFNYGKLGTDGYNNYPCSIDGGGVTFNSTQTEAFSNSKSNLIMYGFQGQAAAFGSRVFVINNSTNVVATVELLGGGFTNPASSAYTNDRTPMLVRTSSECVLNFKTGGYSITVTNGIFSFENVWHSRISIDAAQMNYYFTSIFGGGYNRFNVKATIPNLMAEVGSGGMFVFDTIPLAQFWGASTNTLVNVNVDSYSTDGGSPPIFTVTTGGSIGFTGSIFEHNKTNTHTPVVFGGSAFNCFTDSLYLFNMVSGVSDSGTNDTLNYFKNGKHPFNN